MKRSLRELGKYLYLYVIFIKNCLIAQMEYRTNFLISVFIECAFLFSKILYIIVVFKAGVAINGLTPHAILMFIGSYTMITGIMDAIYFPNVSRIPQYIRTGELDLYITKPVSLQFLVSFRYFDFGLAVPNVIAGLIMVVVAWSRLDVAANLLNIAGYVFYTSIGIVLTYPLLFIPSLLSFWTVKTKSIYEIIWSIWDFNNMPMGIYGKWIQRFGTFIFPIFLVTNFAPMFVMDLLNPIYLIWAIAAPVLFIFILRVIWKVAIRSYTSASS